MKGKIKRFFRKTKIFFEKLNWRKIGFYVFNRILVISIILGIGFFTTLLHIPTDIPIAISSSIIIIILTFDVLFFFYRLTYYMENGRLSKPYKRANNLTLYRWAEGVEIEERFFFKILKDNSMEDPIKNLNSIKTMILEECSGNLTNLRLLKAYVERSLTNNVFEKFWSIIIGLIVGVTTTIISKFTYTVSFIRHVNELINQSKVTIKISYLTTIIHYATYFIIFMLFLMFMWMIFTRDKQRLKLISQIIDISIQEVEAKKSI